MTRLRSRREFLGVLAGGAATVIGCGTSSGVDDPRGGGNARLTARAATPTAPLGPGTWQITPDNANDGFLVVPSTLDTSRPAPLVLALHGAGVGPQGPVNLLGPFAEARGFLLLAVGARGLTWDAITFKYSYDVMFIDGALRWTFERCAVDPARVIVEGFSDGASYALGLALANGDLFSRVVAFSPGFIARSESAAIGKPRFFDSHGRQDSVLRIDNASRQIVPTLRNRGYDVTYVEFDGGHTVPQSIATQAVDWMLG
jgi:phospholipase/carboxylesterase